MAFYPITTFRDLSRLISGSIMIIVASFSIKSISEGSKSVFAYVLMCFTVLLGLTYVGLAINDSWHLNYNYIPNLFAYLTLF
jgi:hypothetical protein